MRSFANLMNLKTLNEVLLLLVANYGGSWVATFTYFLGTRIIKVIDVQAPDFNEPALFSTYFLHTFTTLLICTVFSLSYLFLKDRMRYVFLLAPLLVPSLYGFVLLARYSAG